MGITEGPYQGRAQPACLDVRRQTRLIYVENIRKRAWPRPILARADIYDQPTPSAYSRARSGRSTRRCGRRLDTRCRRRNAGSSPAEGAFSYLARDYGWREAYLWPINADQQGTPQQVRRLIDLVRKNKIPTVFSESTISDKAARQVARETGARYGGVLYVDSLSAADGPVPTYLKLLGDHGGHGRHGFRPLNAPVAALREGMPSIAVEGVTVRYANGVTAR